MNRAAAIGLAYAAAVEDRRILVVTDHRELSNAINLLAAPGFGAVVRRTRGAERIDYPHAGTIRLTTPRSHRRRGLSVDTVYLDEGTGHDPALIADVAPCLAASTRGELIRA